MVKIEPDSIRPKIALVLSGGGARGFAQIGVLKELEKAGIQLDYIVGTSIGAIIGALYSVGYSSDEIDSLMRNTNWDEILSLGSKQDRRDLFIDQKYIIDRNFVNLYFKNFEFVLPDAVSYGTQFYTLLQEMLWNGIYQSENNFDKLKYKFRAVSTDLVSGKSYIHKEGNLATAVKASSTFPLMFSPVRKDSMILVDGGILANIPVEAAKEFNPDIIIAVNSVSPLLDKSDLNTLLKLADQTISISMQHFSNLSLQEADIVITPEIGDHKNVDFTKNEFIFEKGAEAAKSNIGKINALIESKKKIALERIFQDNQFSDISTEKLELKSSGLRMAESQLFSEFQSLNPEAKDFVDFLNKNLISANYSSLNLSLLQGNEGSSIINLVAKDYNKIRGIYVNSLVDSLDKYFSEELNKSFIGKYINNNTIKDIKEFMLKKMQEFGYSFSNIETNVTDSEVLNIHLNLGIIKKIIIHGNNNFSEFLVTREFIIKEGERANSKEVLQTWENLMNTGLFSDIEIVPVNIDNFLEIHIYLIEKGTQAIRIGARVDNERKLQGGIDIIQENFLNVGSRLSFRIAGGERNQHYGTNIEVPRILNTLYTVDFRAYYIRRFVYQYSFLESNPNNFLKKKVVADDFEERFGINAEAGTQIEKNGKFTVQYRFERQRYFNALTSTSDGWHNISSIKIGALFDSMDDIYFPTKGRVIDISLETTFFEPDATIGFSKAILIYGSNISFGDHTFSSLFNFGFADKTLPRPEFFSLGGQDMFFGLREDHERGRQKLLLSIKYRYMLPLKIFFDTYVSLRYDIGSVWEIPENIRFSSLKHGLGGSLSFDTPIGPAEFSLGRAIYYKQGFESILRGPLLGYFSIGISI